MTEKRKKATKTFKDGRQPEMIFSWLPVACFRERKSEGVGFWLFKGVLVSI